MGLEIFHLTFVTTHPLSLHSAHLRYDLGHVWIEGECDIQPTRALMRGILRNVIKINHFLWPH
jgi:hypothetical protein